MTLVDAGPLIALIDGRDSYHRRCVESLPSVTEPLVTTLPVIAEAMFVLGERVGWMGQDRLWELILREETEVSALDQASLQRARELMEKYQDLPMDLADASLVALAESRGLRRVWTLDSDFEIYRLPGRQPFDLVR